jgi:glycine cleavage system H protein
MKFPKDLYYSSEHVWVKVDGDTATIGISDFAQNQLGEILFVEVPEVEDKIVSGKNFGVVESSKQASDLISPISGEVLEVNEKLEDEPEYINEDCYDGWIAKVKLDDPDQVKKLMDSATYEASVAK